MGNTSALTREVDDFLFLPHNHPSTVARVADPGMSFRAWKGGTVPPCPPITARANLPRLSSAVTRNEATSGNIGGNYAWLSPRICRDDPSIDTAVLCCKRTGLSDLAGGDTSRVGCVQSEDCIAAT